MDYNMKNKSKFMIIELIIIIIFLYFIYLIIRSDNILLPMDLANENVKFTIISLSLFFNLISLYATIYYYKQKNNEMIFFYIIYFTLSLLLCFLGPTILLVDINERLIINIFLVNKIIILLSIFPNIKLKYRILQNKSIFFIGVLFACILISFLELMFNTNKVLLETNIIQFLILCGITIYIFIIYAYFKKFIKTKDYIYILLSIILLSSCMKNIYIILFYNDNMINYKYITLLLLISYTSLIMYSFGLLYLSNLDIKNKLKSMQDLDIFYNILDNKLDDKEIYIFDIGGFIIYANEQARKRYNINENSVNFFEEINNMCKIAYESLGEEIRQNILNSVESDKKWSGIVDKSDGDERILEIDKVVSKRYGEVFIVRISQNKEIIKLKKEIAEKNILFDIITKKAGDLITIVDNNKNIKYVNDESCNVLGYIRGEIIGKNLDEIVKGSTDILHTNKFQEISLRCKNGEMIDIETISSPISENSEEGWILIARNITYRRELKNLKEKYDEIKVHNKLKSNFFANLSHELKTPLNIFYSIIQVLDLNVEKDENDFKQSYKKYNKGLKVNFYRMFKMITNLIDLTKLDSNLEKVKFNNYDIVKLCEDISLSVITYAEQKNIKIVFDTEKEEEIIRCNGEYMERIMLNILSNAIKFTPRGGEIFINLFFDSEFVHIKIKDSGIGIPKEKIDSIFEKFVRVDKSFSRENEGSGIGLSIVKSLVELLEGEISLKSEENKGSEFTISLPNIKLNEKDLYEMPTDHIVDAQKITLELSDIYDVFKT